MRCPSCSREIPDNSPVCPECAGMTMAMDTPRKTSSSASAARFAPGEILGGRYRIVALLGKGGMGEVYRAEDLTLDQPVALKFLPPSWAGNADALSRFRNEVKIARQVSHPNVCRVYDLGEINGLCFLSMEYVDGEDLGSLLRRIGRLPADKAIEIARKLCAGLAAAHEKGVLHRDLKPGNIMLDGRGQVLLTDFGLAALAGQIAGGDVTSGTPAYMAPEQLAGEEVTVRSDIYALGLVLYEIFTGKMPYESETLAGLKRARLESAPPSLTTLVRDVDPVVERVIHRCLQSKPALRPPSALAVAAALPGGDPLAAALAAGETPSPEMVAAAGEGAGLAPRVAIPLFATVLIGMLAVCALAIRTSALEKIALPYSTEVLAQKARELTSRLGYTGAFADEAWDFNWYREFIEWVKKNDKPQPRWSEILTGQPGPLRFWYRQSPDSMTGSEFHTDLLTPGIVTSDDPPITTGGMIYLELDAQGRLVYLEAQPPQLLEAAKELPPAPDWGALLSAAGLDATKLTPTEPLWTWLSTSDTRTAWTGVWPGTQRPLRIEAAALRGKPVGFYAIGPWSRPWRNASTGGGANAAGWILAFLALLVCVAAPLLARKNLRGGRGDRRGAARLAGFLFFVQMALWLCRAHITASGGTFGTFLIAICTSVFAAVVVWTVYMAVEPYVRRNWPQTLIGWTGALSGGVQDPVVGRDILIGAATGIFWTLVGAAVSRWQNGGNPAPVLPSTDALLGLRASMGALLTRIPYAARNALLFLFLLFLLRVLVRNQWLAAAVFAGIFGSLSALAGNHPVSDTVLSVLIWGSVAVLILRCGVMALAAGYFVNNALGDIALTTHTSAWYFGNTLFMLAVVVTLVAWAFKTSMAGHHVWKQDWFG